MSHHHQLRGTGPFLTLVATLLGCSGPDADETALPTPAPGSLSQPFSTSPGEPNHEEITAVGLSFLRPEILTALQAANVATDVELVLVNANHFDDCNFTGGSAVVSGSQAEAVQHLDPSTTSPETELLAIRSFARSLHALQDFYAHTNWIELGGEMLVDESLAPFAVLEPYARVASSGFVVVQGRKPKKASVTRNDDAPYPQSASVTVKLPQAERSPGLISGGVDYEPGNFCPDSVAMTHEELNKDKSTNVGRSEQYEAAKSLAILQTRHEWCRLTALTHGAWGDAGDARLAAWVASDASPPDCSVE